jgi:hypothetical protein
MRFKLFLLLVASIAIVASTSFAQDVTFSQSDRSIQYPAQTVSQGDLNRDGYPDFLFGLSDSLNIYTLMSSSGNYVNWSIPTSYCPSYPIAFGDFQRNGKTDLLVSSNEGTSCSGPHSNTFADYMNDGSGTFRLYKKFPVSFFSAQAAVTADFNGDRKLDAVILDSNLLELYYGNGYGSFSGPYKIASLSGYSGSFAGDFYNLIAGDFDGNGCPDVAWTEFESYGESSYQSQLRVAYGDCHGNFSVKTIYNIIGEIDNIQTADLDRDSVSDIVATVDAAGTGVTNPMLQISYGQKNRTFTTKTISDPSLVGPIQVGDFNGDGYPDIAYADWSSGEVVKVLDGDASQSFTGISIHYLTGAGDNTVIQMLSGDYNRDGKTDLALLVNQYRSGPGDFTILSNTSSYPHGTCVPPATPGIHQCSPGPTSGTSVHILAAATNPNPTVYMELWVDGVKRVGYGSTNELNTTLTLTPGTHRLAFFSSDAAGIKNALYSSVTIN